MTSWLKAKFGRMRVSTVVLIVAFIALFWLYQNVEPAAPDRDADACGRPAWLRARPELHLGAADERAAAQGARRHHDHHDDHDRDDNHEPDVADGAHADDRRWSIPTAPAAAAAADDHADDRDCLRRRRRRAGAGAGADDDARFAGIALNRAAQSHRYTGVP